MLAYFLVFFAAVLRLVPHPANFAPVAAVALFGAIYLKRKDAVWVPLLAMVLSDIFIGFDSLISRITVYGAFIIIALMGLWVRNHKNFSTVVGGTFLGSLLFYLITNFAFFYPPVMYSHNWNGVMSSYVAGLPFLRNTIAGDIFFVGLLFGVHELVRLWLPETSRFKSVLFDRGLKKSKII